MKNKFFIFMFLLFSIFSYTYGSVNANNIVYKNYSDGKLYKKNANDVSNGSAITTVLVGNGFSFSSDGQWIIYSNFNDGGRLYKKNANDVSNGSPITTNNSNFPIYSPDGQFIYYIGSYNGISQIFKKNANDVSDGSPITTNNVNKGSVNISPDGQYILYTNSGDGGKIYKKNANDVSNGSAINSVDSQYASYSPDLKWIIYTNFNDGRKLYKKNANDVSNGSVITTVGSQYATYSPDGQYILYTNSGDGGKLYKKNANDVSNGSAVTTVSSIYGIYEPIIGPVNGTCGTNSKYYNYDITNYSGKFCASGNASPTSPAFPGLGSNVSWSCNGINGGSNITCYASRGEAPTPNITGTCGTNATTYNYDVTNYTGTFCASGNAVPTSPAFPGKGSNVNWLCLGSGDGTSANCTASRSIQPNITGTCGTNATTYNYDVTNYTGTFCATGNASPTSPAFPGLGSNVGWSCIGNNGIKTICYASRNEEPTGGGWFPDFSSISKSFDNLVLSIQNIFDFKFEWTGFNISALNFNNFWSIDWDFIGKIKVQTSSEVGNNIYYDVVSGCQAFIYPKLDGYGPDGYANPKPYGDYFYNNPISKKFYAKGNYNERPLYTRMFLYVINNSGNNKLVKMNFMTFEGINIVPFNITIFGIAITEILDNFILYLEKWLLNIISVPMNTLASLYNILYFFGIEFNYNTNYCFFGSEMTIGKDYTKNIILFFDTNQKYVNSISIGIQLINIFIILIFLPVVWRKWVRFLFSNI